MKTASSLFAITLTTPGLTLAASQVSAQEWDNHREGGWDNHREGGWDNHARREHCEMQPRRVMTPYGPRREMVEVCFEDRHDHHRDWH